MKEIWELEQADANAILALATLGFHIMTNSPNDPAAMSQTAAVSSLALLALKAAGGPRPFADLMERLTKES